MGESCLRRSCPVCQNKVGAELLHVQKFTLPDNHPLPGQYAVVACDSCGFVYADLPASQDIYDTYYAEMSKYEMNYACMNSSLYIERAAWISSFIPSRSDSIIDLGCGNGRLLLELQMRDFSDLTGLDPSEKCVSDLKKQGINGIKGSIFSISTNKKYDCAILSGVLEHIYDVGKTMQIMTQLLKHGGRLFVCVPDAARYRDYDTIPFDYFNIEHINHFEEASLLNLGFQHGFSAVGLLKTTISISRTIQPVIFIAYENKGGPASRWPSYARNSVVDYIADTSKNGGINHVISQLSETNEAVILWGAGNYTSRLFASADLDKCNIIMIVDNDKNKQGTSICGKVIYPPDAILEMKLTSAILIGAAVFRDEIVAEIRGMGLDNKIVVLGSGNGHFT